LIDREVFHHVSQKSYFAFRFVVERDLDGRADGARRVCTSGRRICGAKRSARCTVTIRYATESTESPGLDYSRRDESEHYESERNARSRTEHSGIDDTWFNDTWIEHAEQ
jgi:hypothetical protein